MTLETWTTPALADCAPGIEPTEYQVLIVMAEKAEKTAGGIILTADSHEKAQWGADHGRLLAVSPLAFTYEKDWGQARKPQIGDVVFAGRFPGDEIIGRDGRKYRLCEDRAISAVMERATEEQAYG